MIGIKHIEYYIPNNFKSNTDLKNQFNITDDFIENKIGVNKTSKALKGSSASDMAVKAIQKLCRKNEIDINSIECLVLVTQTPDYNIPHTSAIVHGILGMNKNCASFDISLGCSGYIYALSVVKSFMINNKLSSGILVTSDPYSKIINTEDKNTTLLFGDAASATLLGLNCKYRIGNFTFGTSGKHFKSLIKKKSYLEMNGRSIFNFVAKEIPQDISNLLFLNSFKLEEIDLFIFHQASKYLIDTLIKRMNIDKFKVPYEIQNYGNTVSSSIPIILKKRLDEFEHNNIILSGFGVGLSWSSTVIIKNSFYEN